MADKTCLTYWFPKLLEAGLPAPLTRIMKTDVVLWHLTSEEEPPDGWLTQYRQFIADLTKLADSIGYPCFLRTGHGSGKHLWKDTCYLTCREDLESHVAAIVEWSETVDMIGLPTNVWCVREMLPTEPICTLPKYGDFPLVREVRYFVKDGNVVCWHPYWPEGAIKQGLRQPPASIDAIIEQAQVHDPSALVLADQVAKVFSGDGAWSVDLLETKRGWYVTDMAAAARSFHWEGCPHAAELKA